jgi:hypothetical protein
MTPLKLRLVGVAVMGLLPFGTLAQVQLQPLFALDPGSRPYLPAYPGDNGQRGVAYNPRTGDILLVNRTGGLSVNVLDGLTGADKGMLDTTGISGGTFSLSQIAVASDGAIYAANLVTSSSGAAPFKIYRWADQSAVPTVVYSGEVAAGTRWGDNIEIRGRGNDTQLLFGQGGRDVGNRLAIFTTSDDGASFSPTVLALSGQGFVPGDSRGGVAFGDGDTFFTKNATGDALYYGTFDLATSTAVVTGSGTLTGGVGTTGFSALATMMSYDLLAALNPSTAANPQTAAQNVVLFDVSNPAQPIPLDVEAFINPGAQNLNSAGAVDFGNGELVALDTNNGLRAYSLIPEPGTGALLVLGLAALGLCRRNPRRS